MVSVTVSTKTTQNNAQAMLAAVRLLTKRRVLVGFPKATAARKEGGPSNALLAYVHDNGSPLAGIPRREFMRPGILDSREPITQQLKIAGTAALGGDKAGVERGLNGAGLAAQAGIRKKINTGPFTPLKPATLRARKRAGFLGTKPLIRTTQMRTAVNFIVE